MRTTRSKSRQTPQSVPKHGSRRSKPAQDVTATPENINNTPIQPSHIHANNGDDDDDVDELADAGTAFDIASTPIDTPLRPTTRSQTRAGSLRNLKLDSPNASSPTPGKSSATKKSPATQKPRAGRRLSADENLPKHPPVTTTAAEETTTPTPQQASPQLQARIQKRRRLKYTDNIVPHVAKTSPPTPPTPGSEVDSQATGRRKAPRSGSSTITHPHVTLLKNIALRKLAGQGPVTLHGLDAEQSQVRSLLHQTVHAGHGNSMMIIGARGTGKTTLVNQLLDELSARDKQHVHVVKLNGFIHTDDKLALREIWHQLGREMQVDDHVPELNYADTLTTLLAVLSHPAELSSDAAPDQAANSVIFILDEFDQFASYPRQTLLYNLFDIAQSRKAPIAVLGLATRVDIIDALEKRVKSRFSHRSVHLSLPRSLADFTQICKSAMRLDAQDVADEPSLTVHGIYIDPPPPHIKKHYYGTKCLQGMWNSAVDKLFEHPELNTHLASIYHTTRSVATAQTSLMPVVASLECKSADIHYESDVFTAEDFDLTSLAASLPPDSKLSLLPTLPTLALALLIAAARLNVILDTDLANFNMAYEEYVAVTARARSNAALTAGGAAMLGGRVWSRSVARGMWERLVELELLVPASGRGLAADIPGSGPARPTAVVSNTDMVRCDVALEEIEGAVPDMDKMLEAWCREI